MSRRSRCTACSAHYSTDAEVCPRCGAAIIDDAGATTLYEPDAGTSLDDRDAFEATLVRSRRKRLLAAAAIGIAAMVAAVSIVVVAGRDGSKATAGGVDKPITPAVAASEDRAWVAPTGKREDVETLAYAFPAIDEQDLGAVFDAELKPVYGAPPLFEPHEPRRVKRDEMFHSLMELNDTIQLEAGFRYLL